MAARRTGQLHARPLFTFVVGMDLVRDALVAERARLLKPYRGDLGVFEARRAWEIVDVLAGGLDAAMVEFTDSLRTCEHFLEVGARVVRFLNAFDARRKRAKKGTKRYVPSDDELRHRFGDDWEVVRMCWPAVRFLKPLRDLRRRGGAEERERALRNEAWVILDALAPNDQVRSDVRAHLYEAVRRLRGRRPDVKVETLVDEALSPGRARERMLTYAPKFDARKAYEHWITASRNRARDHASSPLVIGEADGRDIMRSRGTMRRWKALDKQRGSVDTRTLAQRALDADARRDHHDPLGQTITASQLAKRLNRPTRTIAKAVAAAVTAGAIVGKRLPGAPSYALTEHDIEKIRPFIPSPKTSKKETTISRIAAAMETTPDMIIGRITDILERRGINAPELSNRSIVPEEMLEWLAADRAGVKRRA